MAKACHRDAAPQIQITVAGDIKNFAARAMAQRQVEAPVAGHHVLGEQLADRLELVMNNRRRHWNNLFHHEQWKLSMNQASGSRKKSPSPGFHPSGKTGGCGVSAVNLFERLL